MRLPAILCIAAACLGAEPPPATITSAQPFRLSGATVPVAGVPHWPLLRGDEVVLGDSPGEVIFRDGSRVFVLPKSVFQVSRDGAAGLRLSQGGLRYIFTKDSVVSLAARDLPALPRDAREGTLLVKEGEAYWTPRDPAFLAGSGDGRPEYGEFLFVRYRLTPIDLDYAVDWPRFNPEWGNTPTGNVSAPPGPLPPGPVFHTPYLPPVSPWYPGKP